MRRDVIQLKRQSIDEVLLKLLPDEIRKGWILTSKILWDAHFDEEPIGPPIDFQLPRRGYSMHSIPSHAEEEESGVRREDAH